ncbi:MAG: oligoendopeptidase F [Bacilli bacterium]|nr:oligoendopeptidase F [Bacilli bacterium]
MKRTEIDNKYKWDLTTIYKTEEDFLVELNNIKIKISNISKYEELIKKDLSCLFDMIYTYYDIVYFINKLFLYAHLLFDTDTKNEKYQEYVGKVSNLDEDFSKLSSYMIPALLKYDYSDILNQINNDNRLKEYAFTLEKIFREKEHVLSEKEEKLISNLGKAFDSSSDLFEIITDSDLKYGTIKDENGNDIELNDSNYNLYMTSSDRRVRKDAYNCLYSMYKQFKNTLSKTLSNHIEAYNTISKVRNYNSALEASLFEDNISKDVFDTLIDTVSNNLEPLYKYYRLRKKVLNVDTLEFYDLHAPIVKEFNKEYTFEEAKEIVLNALSPLGEEYISIAKDGFNNRWFDVYYTEGKRSGGYSTGIKGTLPFILINYEGKLNDVSTVAHELGHSMHSYYSNKNCTFQDSFYTIYCGEVTSTVNELLLANYIINNSNDDNEKLYVLNHLLDVYKSTLFRQTMFQEFEKNIYELSSKGEILNSDLLSNEYSKVCKKYFGDTINYNDNYSYEYARVPHFYCNFYVFTYATGIIYATKIVNDILNNKEESKEKYIEFLKTGGSMYPEDELKVAGIDVHDKDVYLSAINYYSKLVDEFEKLIEKVK